MAAFLMEPMLKDGRFVSILDDWTNDPMPIHVVYPQNRHLSAKVRVFVEWVIALFAKHPGMGPATGRSAGRIQPRVDQAPTAVQSPPLAIQLGTAELLFDDACRHVAAAAARGGLVRLDIRAGARKTAALG